MKIRYPVIGAIIILVLLVGLESIIEPQIASILGVLLLVCLGLIACLIIRNIFRAVKGAVAGEPQGSGYRDEARKACEKVTPKREQTTTPPWEE